MLTKKQKEIYEFICLYRKENGIPPTIHEIAYGTFTSDQYAITCVDALEDKGYITRQKGKRRSIVITKADGYKGKELN